MLRSGHMHDSFSMHTTTLTPERTAVIQDSNRRPAGRRAFAFASYAEGAADLLPARLVSQAFFAAFRRTLVRAAFRPASLRFAFRPASLRFRVLAAFFPAVRFSALFAIFPSMPVVRKVPKRDL